jgi:3-phosphoglycerate kinase
MNKRDALFFGGGLLLGFLIFVQYGKYKGGQSQASQEQEKKCKDLLEIELQTIRPTDDFDIEAFKKDFMEKCLKGQ